MEEFEICKDIDLEKGLSSSQVEERIKQKLVNTTLTKTSKSYAKIILSNIFTWLNIVCFIVAGVLIAIGSFNNIFFLLIFFCNLFIGLFQEIKAKRMVDKISVIYNAKVEVLRDGEKKQIEINEVVKDDIIFIKNGDQICADCLLLEGEIETNESLLTGESKPIKKQKGDSLLGGSYVVSGTCKAITTNVGLETYSSTLIKKARQLKTNQSDILKTLNFIIKTIGIIIIPLGILTFLDIRSKMGVIQAIERTSGSVIGMLPVGMFLLTSVSLVVGVINLAKKKTLVQNLYSIEMLARANVLCLDKTGTLTDGTMSVKNVIPINKSIEDVTKIMQSYVIATKSQNSTSIALDEYFKTEDNVENAKKVIEFSSDRKFSAVEFENLGTFMLGAPEFVTDKKNLDKELKQTIKDITQDGLRVILLCQSKEINIDENISKQNTPLSLIVIEDNIRPDAKETIEWFNNNEVQIKIISGDNVDTVSNISKKVGVLGYDKAISLENLSDDEVIAAANKYNVFGRVTPEQKCLLVKALRSTGSKVAMTGDGVNDILALKESDCSIAMASGSEATRSASNLIMLENNFSAMPSIVAEGRRVINNISKASSLFLTKTFFTMFLTIFTLVSVSYVYPLQPIQIFLWETLFIGIPAFFLALQPSRDRVKGSFLASLASKALPGAFVLFIGAMACYIYCELSSSIDMVSTLISCVATFGAFFILLNLCLPLNKYRSILVFSLLALCFLALLVLPKSLFEYMQVSNYDILFIIIAVICVYPLYALFKLIFEKIFNYTVRKNKEKKEKKNA